MLPCEQISYKAREHKAEKLVFSSRHVLLLIRGSHLVSMKDEASMKDANLFARIARL